MRKLASLIMNAGVTKGLGLATHFILSSYLSPDEFGIYAIVVTISAFLLVVRNGGVQQYLIHRFEDMSQLRGVAYRYGLLFNAAAMILLVMVARPISNFYESPILFELLLIVAASIPISTVWFIYRAELLAQAKFDRVSVIAVVSDLAKYSLTIALVVKGCGLYGLVIPLLVEACLLAALGRANTKNPIKMNKDRRLETEIFGAAKWIMLSNLAVALTKQGDYFALSIFVEKNDLGTYYFAYQLVFSVAVFFITVSELVLIPVFSRSKEDRAGLIELFTTSVMLSTIVAVGISLVLHEIIGHLIAMLWGGKWDSAIQVTLAFLPLVVILNVFYMTRALADAMGRWRSRFFFNLMNGLGVIGVASVCAAAGWQLVDIATALVAFQAAVALAQFQYLLQIAGVSLVDSLKFTGALTLPPLIVAWALAQGALANFGNGQCVLLYGMYVTALLLINKCLLDKKLISLRACYQLIRAVR